MVSPVFLGPDNFRYSVFITEGSDKLSSSPTGGCSFSVTTFSVGTGVGCFFSSTGAFSFFLGAMSIFPTCFNPESFFESLRTAGLEIIPHAFPDHYDYTPVDISFADELPVLMTQKDAVKCTEFANRNCWVVTVSVEVDEGILEIIMKKINEIKTNG